jgi:hypothetical protein
MPSRSNTRITIDVDGTPRRILSIATRSNGDAVLIIKSADRFRDLGHRISDPGESELHNTAIIEERYSIHRSPKSSEGINLIKHTLRLENSREKNHYHHTSALKDGGRFAWIFSKRFPSLRNPKYVVPTDSTERVSLGSYRPEMFCLYVGFYVCDKNTAFQCGSARDFSALEIIVGDFKICVFWSFIGYQSDADSELQHSQTMDPGIGNSLAVDLMRGYDLTQTIVHFKHLRMDSLMRYRDLVVRHATDPTPEKLFRAAAFFRTGVYPSLEAEELLAELLMRTEGFEFVTMGEPKIG